MRHTMQRIASITGRLLLACLLVLSQGVWAAGQEQKAKDNPKPEQKATTQPAGEKLSTAAASPRPQAPNVEGEESEKAGTQEKPSGDGKHEGIKVHGHWTIEIKNPDGTLATHREFNNSYLADCAVQSRCNVLPSVLGRTITVGTYQVDLGVSLLTEGSNLSASVVQPAQFAIAQLVLSGSSGLAPAYSSGGSISTVTTSFYSCAPSVAPASCNSSNSTGTVFLTVAQLTTPQPVLAGQTIAVTVNISFS